MQKRIFLSFPFLLFCITAFAQPEWNFSTNTEGWTLTNSLTGSVSSDILTITTTGTDPYMHSPVNLGINASQIKTLKIKAKNRTNQSKFQIYWISDQDQNWGTNGKLVQLDVAPNSTAFVEYIFDFSSVSTWSGTIKQIRLDPGNPAAGSNVDLDYIKLGNDLYTLVVDNGKLKLKVDLLKGGAISYLSKSTDNNNLINIYDRGRYIQQSYYAGAAIDRKAEGQHPSWSPWNWNPIQVGDVYNNSSPVLASSATDSTIYTKTQPLLWDMNNELGQCYMEMWLALRGNTVHVKNKLQAFRTDSRWTPIPRHQELPAVYIIGDLNNLYTYKGTAPFTSDAPDKIINSGPPWTYWNSPEHWAALVNSSNWGVGVYNANSTYFVGGYSGSAGGSSTTSSTGYMSPLRTETLDKTSVYEYEYDLIVGSLSEIRAFAYAKENKTLPLKFKSLTAQKLLNKIVVTWHTLSESNIRDFAVQRSTDGVEYTTKAVIPAKGHNSEEIYTYDDFDDLNGQAYYRIESRDGNGEITYSQVILVKQASKSTYILVNPASDQVELTFSQAFTGTVQLMDLLGKKLSEKKLYNHTGLTLLDIPVGLKGVCLLTIAGNGFNSIEKLLIP